MEDSVLQWEKTMSRSDAQNETAGAPMPFLRLTKEDLRNDEWPMWFRDTFFRGLTWEPALSQRRHHIEVAYVEMHVVILGLNLGPHVFKLDHDPLRLKNHGAPPTHLHFPHDVRHHLDEHDTEGHTIALLRDRDGKFRLVIK